MEDVAQSGFIDILVKVVKCIKMCEGKSERKLGEVENGETDMSIMTIMSIARRDANL